MKILLLFTFFNIIGSTQELETSHYDGPRNLKYLKPSDLCNGTNALAPKDICFVDYMSRYRNQKIYIYDEDGKMDIVAFIERLLLRPQHLAGYPKITYPHLMRFPTESVDTLFLCNTPCGVLTYHLMVAHEKDLKEVVRKLTEMKFELEFLGSEIIKNFFESPLREKLLRLSGYQIKENDVI